MEDKKRILVLRDDKGEIWGRYLKFESIHDLYIYMGKLFNASYVEIKITYLYFYSFDFDNFENFCENVGINSTLCTYKEGKTIYHIKLEYIN